jgi:hypothetical protein
VDWGGSPAIVHATIICFPCYDKSGDGTGTISNSIFLK